MSIELRILSGSRAGQSEAFEKSVIAIGRHPLSDLRFDATHDIDVSTRHGEIRGVDGRYTITDHESTNGTFVNGERVPSGGSRELRSGDVLGFGAHGPTVGVRIADSRTTPIGDRVTSAIPTPPIGVIAQPASAPPASAPRRPTTERVAIAVAEQTRGLKIAVFGAVIVLGGLAAGGWWMGHREAAVSDGKLQSLIAADEQTSKRFAERVNDTAMVNSLRRERDSLVKIARTARGGDAVVAQQALERHQNAARTIGEMDTPAVAAANNPAVVLIHSSFGENGLEATGFSVSSSGTIVTNRHVIEDGRSKAARVMVKFADTPVWHQAHVVRVASDTSVDLALLQLDEAGNYPAVKGIASSVDVPVGGGTMSLGFPDGTDLPMDGSRATTSLTVGIVSKSIQELIQIDSYASHGSSGSPVFDAHGHVIGVVWGGPKNAAGRIVYAVPAERITELVNGAGGGGAT
jgi:S1-C subfamily serine protease